MSVHIGDTIDMVVAEVRSAEWSLDSVCLVMVGLRRLVFCVDCPVWLPGADVG